MSLQSDEWFNSTARARLVVRRAKCKQNYQIERPSPMQMIVRHFKVFTLGFHFASAFIFLGGACLFSHILANARAFAVADETPPGAGPLSRPDQSKRPHYLPES